MCSGVQIYISTYLHIRYPSVLNWVTSVGWFVSVDTFLRRHSAQQEMMLEERVFSNGRIWSPGVVNASWAWHDSHPQRSLPIAESSCNHTDPGCLRWPYTQRENTFLTTTCRRQAGKGHWVCCITWEHLKDLHLHKRQVSGLQACSVLCFSLISVPSCATDNEVSWTCWIPDAPEPEFLGNHVAWKQLWSNSAATDNCNRLE